VLESGLLDACQSKVTCSMFISLYLVMADNTSNASGKIDLWVVGSVGTFCAIIMSISNITAMLKTDPDEDIGIGGDTENEIVTEIADFWITFSIFTTTIYMLMAFAFAFNPEGFWSEVGQTSSDNHRNNSDPSS